jgi:hypothetical protein
MDTELDDILRAERRRRLIEPSTAYGERLGHSRARQHLVEGFNRRVLMLDCSINHIHDIAEEAGEEPLSTYAIPELAIHVNSIWLNICGALDNLAWAIAYTFDLLPGLGEGQGEGRDSIGLANGKYLTRLTVRDPAFAAQLQTFVPWQTELRSLRDPAAHRIPIYPIPGILDGDNAEQAQRLFAEANDLMLRGELGDGLELINRGNALARFEPWIILSHDGRLEVRHLHQQIKRDEEQFVAAAEVVLNRLFRDTFGFAPI